MLFCYLIKLNRKYLENNEFKIKEFCEKRSLNFEYYINIYRKINIVFITKRNICLTLINNETNSDNHFFIVNNINFFIQYFFGEYYDAKTLSYHIGSNFQEFNIDFDFKLIDNIEYQTNRFLKNNKILIENILRNNKCLLEFITFYELKNLEFFKILFDRNLLFLIDSFL